MLLKKLHEYSEAVPILMRCIEMNPKKSENYYELGLVYYEMGIDYYNRYNEIKYIDFMQYKQKNATKLIDTMKSALKNKSQKNNNIKNNKNTNNNSNINNSNNIRHCPKYGTAPRHVPIKQELQTAAQEKMEAKLTDSRKVSLSIDVLSGIEAWRYEFDHFWKNLSFPNDENDSRKQNYYSQFVTNEVNSIVCLAYMRKNMLEIDDKYQIHMTCDDSKYFFKQRRKWIESNLLFINWLHKLKMFDKYYKKFEYFGILNLETLIDKTQQLNPNIIQQMLVINVTSNYNTTDDETLLTDLHHDELERDVQTMLNPYNFLV